MKTKIFYHLDIAGELQIPKLVITSLAGLSIPFGIGTYKF